MATKVSCEDLLEELWSCMLDELQCLTFNEGKKLTFTTEPLMLAGIQAIAVAEKHTSVH